ncbi:MAG: hypothetical protein E6Q39_01200 [Crocinitomicaceae bacterium]|jgi:hypothetical protein|nr:MAG: hypothetical protein E6Q39_01200 [Crocinitomicaceae bacterium]
MKTHEPDYKSGLLGVLCFIFTMVFMFGEDYLFEKKAKNLARDEKNIVEGCLYLKKKYSYKGAEKYDVDIDGKIYNI